MVAMELAASCSPLRKSKKSATATRTRSTGAKPKTMRPPALYVLDHDAADAVRHILEAVHHFFEVIVDFRAHDEAHGVGIAVGEIERLDAPVRHLVGAFLLAHDLLGQCVDAPHILAHGGEQRHSLQ